MTTIKNRATGDFLLSHSMIVFIFVPWSGGIGRSGRSKQETMKKEAVRRFRLILRGDSLPSPVYALGACGWVWFHGLPATVIRSLSVDWCGTDGIRTYFIGIFNLHPLKVNAGCHRFSLCFYLLLVLVDYFVFACWLWSCMNVFGLHTCSLRVW